MAFPRADLAVVAGEDPAAVATGLGLLHSLGATGTLVAVSRRKI
jgi:hypothetical protein